jgi:transposase InsO family protein
MDDNYKTSLITAAIEMAAWNIAVPADAVFHSDGGSNYTSAQFAVVLEGLGIRQSVEQTGICFDNALADRDVRYSSQKCLRPSSSDILQQRGRPSSIYTRGTAVPTRPRMLHDRRLPHHSGASLISPVLHPGPGSHADEASSRISG